MKENILYVFILFFMLACGAQNNPREEVTGPSTTSAEEDDVITNDFVSQGSTILLPKSVAIDFPEALHSSSNIAFNKNVQRIQKIINTKKYNLELLELAIEEIGKECPDINTTCHFGKDNFRVNYKHQTIILGEIRFNKYKEENKSEYALLLNLNDNVSLQYEWKEDENNVFTTYLDGNNSVKLHYFSESNKSEASYIEDSLINEKNSFMINWENNGTFLYFLTSNHIKNNKQDFSSILRVEDKALIEDNASFYNFNISEDDNPSDCHDVDIVNDSSPSREIASPDSITLLNLIESQDLKDGDYLVFESEIKVETLNLLERLRLSIGRFTYFKGEVFGLVLNEVSSESFSGFKIIPLD